MDEFWKSAAELSELLDRDLHTRELQPETVKIVPRNPMDPRLKRRADSTDFPQDPRKRRSASPDTARYPAALPSSSSSSLGAARPKTPPKAPFPWRPASVASGHEGGSSGSSARHQDDRDQNDWHRDDWHQDDWQSWEDPEAEAAKAHGIKMKFRGPPPPEDPHELWKGQRFRPGSERWGNRGGAKRPWWDSYYAAIKAGADKRAAKAHADKLHPDPRK